jgi:sigma-B regulation protein RsbU (phosphoserine phosphatase)
MIMGSPGDQVIFYTDGITEAKNPAGELFGVARLDAALTRCNPDAQHIVQRVLDEVERFSEGRPPDDDRTVLVAKIR